MVTKRIRLGVLCIGAIWIGLAVWRFQLSTKKAKQTSPLFYGPSLATEGCLLASDR